MNIILADVLHQDGNQVELVEIEDRNVVEIWVYGEIVFKCDIRELDFGKTEKQ